jgi:hypothetical protein
LLSWAAIWIPPPLLPFRPPLLLVSIDTNIITNITAQAEAGIGAKKRRTRTISQQRKTHPPPLPRSTEITNLAVACSVGLASTPLRGKGGTYKP